MTTRESQSETCAQFGTELDLPADDENLGVALSTLDQAPLNGLRHPRKAGTCGWYIWGGKSFPSDDEAFSPLHVSHLPDCCPAAIRFLGLPPGWRFLTDGDYVDVWEDRELLNVFTSV